MTGFAQALEVVAEALDLQGNFADAIAVVDDICAKGMLRTMALDILEQMSILGVEEAEEKWNPIFIDHGIDLYDAMGWTYTGI